MKKIIPSLLLVMLAFSLVACGESSEESTSKRKEKDYRTEEKEESKTNDNSEKIVGVVDTPADTREDVGIIPNESVEEEQIVSWEGTPVVGDNANYAGMDAWETLMAAIEWTNNNANYVETHFIPSEKAIDYDGSSELVSIRTAEEGMFYCFERIYRTNDGGRADNFVVRSYNEEDLMDGYYLSIRDWDSSSYAYSESFFGPDSKSNQSGDHYNLVDTYYDYFADEVKGMEVDGDTIVVSVSSRKYYIKNGLIEKREVYQFGDLYMTTYYSNYMVKPEGYTNMLLGKFKSYSSELRENMDQIGEALGLKSNQ